MKWELFRARGMVESCSVQSSSFISDLRPRAVPVSSLLRSWSQPQEEERAAALLQGV